MTQQSRPEAARARPGERPSRTPELPRVTLDTRMPPAPAPGGRIIQVAAPVRGRGAASDSAGILLGALVLAAVATVCWRYIWPRGPGRRVL